MIPRNRRLTGTECWRMLARSSSAALLIVTHDRSAVDPDLRTATCSGAIAAATMLGTEIAAGDRTMQLGTVRSSCALAVPSNIATNSLMPGRTCSTMRE